MLIASFCILFRIPSRVLVMILVHACYYHLQARLLPCNEEKHRMKRWSTADVVREEEREWETSNETSEEVTRSKVRKLETLPFGHRREHLAAYVPNIKGRTSPQADLYLPFSLCKFSLCPRLGGSENSAESPMRLARLSLSVEINGSAPRVGRWSVSCWSWLLPTAY